jgi:hypothetical protein
LELTAELFELSSESKQNAGEETDKKK